MQPHFLVIAGLLITAPAAAQQTSQSPNLDNQKPATSGCRVRMTPSPGSWVIDGYDPFSSDSPTAVYSITYTNDGTAECRFVPVFELSDPPFGMRKGTGDLVRYNLTDITGSKDVTPRAGRSPRTLGQRQIILAPNASETVTYRLTVDPADVRSDGLFSQETTVEAQDSQFVSYGGTRLVLGISVLPSARIGLSGAYRMSEGQAFVNLGQLREGTAAVPLNLRVNSTGNYSLNVTSANNGKLCLDTDERCRGGGAGDAGWSVPYSLGLDGNSVKLTESRGVSPRRSGAGYRRDTLPIQFFIGSIDNLRAGNYSDTITIAVTPN